MNIIIRDEIEGKLIEGAGMVWELTDTFIVIVDGTPIIVPKGFKTNFASVPKAFHSVISQIGKHAPAAVVHDWLYYFHIYNRKYADFVFLEIMKHLGVTLWKRQAMYYAVRMFGWVAWNANARKNECYPNDKA